MMDSTFSWILLFDASLRLATPLMFAALAGFVSERAGVMDIGLEGKMLLGAFAAATIASVTGSAWQGVLAAIVITGCFSLLHAFACITHKGDHVVSGLAINLLAAAITALLAQRIFVQGGMTPILSDEQRLPTIEFPNIITHDDGLLSQIYWHLLSGHNILVYLAFIAVFLTIYLMKYSTWGIVVLAAGDNPTALKRAGFSVSKIRYMAVVVGGCICGLAGAFLSIGHGAGFVENMTVGKGFIALAALIFGRWHPIGVMLSCLFFGFLEALAIRLQESRFSDVDSVIPIQLLEVTPYVLTLCVLAGVIGKSAAPATLGKPMR
ncbi:ABC transporter permease [Psychrobium sp. nBUS_13]|uniref:ABC transporter permease n=1 Tax=Psychrobium sp. nBUS_13 TaxID=3395319 RepID=UPI003EB82072